MHEAQLWSDNCYLTLTFSDEHLPPDYSVHVRDWQLFMKSFRKFVYPKKIRFYMGAEYGDENLRPHYHAIIFNYDFNDKIFFKKNHRGDNLYTSPSLSKIWPYGFATLGDVTFESAAYVSRYVCKKQTGEQAASFYLRQNPVTKFWHQVEPEFSLCSRRPGIASDWLKKYKTDVYPSDFIVARNMKMVPPRFYDNQLSEEELTALKRRRKKNGLRQKANQTPARLRVRATVRDARTKNLRRTL